jgi:nucleoid-associated protein YgaU
MMRETPRSFVGTVTLRLCRVPCPHQQQRARAEIAALGGVRLRGFEEEGSAVSVTADQPTDRTAVVQALERAGCQVRA